ncbi:hypothetical protein A5658_12900 [Mycobacterium sp. 1245111.1]|nr:hypothetical protein A5658_12900 [Mycobacterium sp. 1245111.1]
MALDQPLVYCGEDFRHRAVQLRFADDRFDDVRVGVVIPKASLFADERRAEAALRLLLVDLALHGDRDVDIPADEIMTVNGRG